MSSTYPIYSELHKRLALDQAPSELPLHVAVGPLSTGSTFKRNETQTNMKIEIDIDPEQANRSFTVRERVALHLLLVVFRMVMPAKYGHQVNSALEPIGDLLKAK